MSVHFVYGQGTSTSTETCRRRARTPGQGSGLKPEPDPSVDSLPQERHSPHGIGLPRGQPVGDSENSLVGMPAAGPPVAFRPFTDSATRPPAQIESTAVMVSPGLPPRSIYHCRGRSRPNGPFRTYNLSLHLLCTARST